MANSLDKTIRRALMVPLYNAAVAASFFLPGTSEPAIQWPRRAFNPNDIDRYIRWTIDYASMDAKTIGRTPRIQATGFVTCDVFWQKKLGEDGADDLVSMAVDAYPYAAELVRDGIRVSIGVTELKTGVLVDDWFGAPVKINWTVWRTT